jgi:hypothetical protein
MNILEAFKYNQHFVAMMNIINSARHNPPVKGHNHHIIPRCWFKLNNIPTDNSKDNLVLLTVEDHKLVHKLAYLCAEDDIKSSLRYAYLMTSNIFEETSLIGEDNPFYGHKHSNATKAKISKSKKGVPNPKISEIHKGMKMSNESSIKKSKATKGKPKSNSCRENQLNSRRKLSNEYSLYKLSNGKLTWNDWLRWRKNNG